MISFVSKRIIIHYKIVEKEIKQKKLRYQFVEYLAYSVFKTLANYTHLLEEVKCFFRFKAIGSTYIAFFVLTRN